MKFRVASLLGLFALCASAILVWEKQTAIPEASPVAVLTKATTVSAPEPEQASSLPIQNTELPTREVVAAPSRAPVQRTHKLVLRTGEPVDWLSDTPAAHQAQVVELDTSLFTDKDSIRVGDVLEFELFGQPYTTQVGTVNNWSNGTVGITARIPEHQHSHAYLSFTGEVARLLVKDYGADKTYQIRYDTVRQEHVALEVDMAGSDVRGCNFDELLHTPVGSLVAHASEGEPDFEMTPSALPSPTTGVTFDVLIVYSPAALAIEGGSVANMQNNISQAVVLANTVLSNSQINASVNLVHTEQVTYTEQNPRDDLDNLTYTTDGYMDNVHALRDTHNADFVGVFLDTATGGLGWGGTDYHSPDWAFHLARIQQTDWTTTMIHEMGHNMGLGHSATQASFTGPGDIYPYGAGWQWADGSSPASVGYCSVMTYEDFDNNSGNGSEYREIPYFSNPNLTYNGNPIGDASSGDAARVIQQGRFEMASYRGAEVVPSDAITTFPYTNSFESNLDYFYQDSGDDHLWIGTQSGDSTPGFDTGPSSGAQDGTYYAYVYGWDPYTSTPFYNQTANLLARVDFSGKENAAISFYYHMYGGFGQMGSLHLDASTNGGSTWDTDLWSISGNQGDSWHLQQVDLSAYDDTSILLRFRVVTGSGFLTDTCLDNLTITADDLPAFSSWISANYPGISDASSGGDPDADGVSNFLEYALGMTPNSADASDLPTVAFNSGDDTLGITFTRAQSGVRYVVESSSTPDFASPAQVWDSAATPADLVAVGANQTVTVPISAGSDLFLRVQVSE